MNLHEVATDTFVLLQSAWLVEKARQLIEHLLESTHVIGHRTDPEDYYYLYTRSEALDRLVHAADQMSIHDAFKLHEYTATHTLDAYADAEAAPDRSIVIEEGHVIGFFDVTVRPSEEPTRRIGERDLKPGDLVARSLVADFPEQVRLEETVSLPGDLYLPNLSRIQPCQWVFRWVRRWTLSPNRSAALFWKEAVREAWSFLTKTRRCPCNSNSRLPS